MKHRAWIFGVAVIFFWQLAIARQYEIYVFNQPFIGKAISRNGKIYVPVEALAKALNLPIENKENSLWIGKEPQKKVNGKIILNGTPFSDDFNSEKNVCYVALKSFVEISGNKLIINNETKIIDILPGNSSLSQNALERLPKTLATEQSLADSAFLTYHNARFGFKIKYPKNWKKIENYKGAIVIFTAPRGNAPSATIVGILAETMPSDLSSDKYLEYFSNAAKQSSPGGDVKSNLTSIGGYPAVESVNSPVLVSGVPLMMRSIDIIVNSRQVLLISYGSNEQAYYQFSPTFDAMLKSFEVNP